MLYAVAVAVAVATGAIRLLEKCFYFVLWYVQSCVYCSIQYTWIWNLVDGIYLGTYRQAISIVNIMTIIATAVAHTHTQAAMAITTNSGANKTKTKLDST